MHTHTKLDRIIDEINARITEDISHENDTLQELKEFVYILQNNLEHIYDNDITTPEGCP